MKKVKTPLIDESYLIFVGYDYSPSGYDIGCFNLSGCFELQGNGSHLDNNDSIVIYELPKK